MKKIKEKLLRVIVIILIIIGLGYLYLMFTR